MQCSEVLRHLEEAAINEKVNFNREKKKAGVIFRHKLFIESVSIGLQLSSRGLKPSLIFNE
jgi:hypothetical protein